MTTTMWTVDNNEGKTRMQSEAEARETLAMMAAYHELRYVVHAGKPSPSAESVLDILKKAIDVRADSQVKLSAWLDASCQARLRMIKSQRRPA